LAPTSIPEVKKKKKPAKVMKDPAAPRRPMTPFLVFAKEERRKVLGEMGNIAMGEVSKEIGKRWGVLAKNEKERYEAAYLEDKARYGEEMKSYQPSQQFLDMRARQESMNKMKGGDGDRTDGESMVNYFTFLMSNWSRISAETPGLGGKEVQEMAWVQWSRGQTVGGGMKKPKKEKRMVDPAAPKKPPTAFFLFQKKMRSGGLAMSGKTLGDMWNKMDEEGKNVYKKDEVEMRKVYLGKMAEYKKGKEEGEKENI